MASPARCPSCGQETPAASSHCPHCGKPIPPDKRDQAVSGRSNPWSFSIAELLLGTTYIAVLLGATLAAPEWGLYLWVISAFALARTIWYSVAWKRAGHPFAPLAQAGSFAESLLVMGLISSAATIAFLGTCLPLGTTVVHCCGPNDSDLLANFAWVVGVGAGLASGGYLLWNLWTWPVVIWWRTKTPPAMLDRIAELGRSIVVLASTMLGSGLTALTSAWTWMQSLAEQPEQRDARTNRIILYLVLLAGYVTGTVLGILLGRQIAARVRLWFWPILSIGVVGALVSAVLASRALPDPFRDDSGVSASLCAIDLVLIVGLIIHRILAKRV